MDYTGKHKKLFAKRKEISFTHHQMVDIEILVNQFLKQKNLSDKVHFQKLKENFDSVVGKLLSPHVIPEKIEKGILALKVDNSVWKSELYLQKKAIIDKCNSLMGKEIIHNIRFI